MWSDIPADEAALRDDLVDRLRVAGICYLGGGHVPPSSEAQTMPLQVLIPALASSRDARLRTALVALLLRNPHYAAVATSVAEAANDAKTARSVRIAVLAAAALQRAWAFSLDIYLPGWQPIVAEADAHCLDVPRPDEDYGRATLSALDRLLAGDDPVAPDYLGAWEDAGRHMIADLREESAAHVA
jgi:hypothetical protein